MKCGVLFTEKLIGQICKLFITLCLVIFGGEQSSKNAQFFSQCSEGRRGGGCIRPRCVSAVILDPSMDIVRQRALIQCKVVPREFCLERPTFPQGAIKSPTDSAEPPGSRKKQGSYCVANLTIKSESEWIFDPMQRVGSRCAGIASWQVGGRLRWWETKNRLGKKGLDSSKNLRKDANLGSKAAKHGEFSSGAESATWDMSALIPLALYGGYHGILPQL